MTGTEEEKTRSIQTKFIVVSLPRTGTKSMCQMLKVLGFNVVHVAGPGYKDYMRREATEVIADTPMFRPSVIEEALEGSDAVKFIYVNKNPEDWVTSMEKINLSHNYNNMYANQDKLSVHSQIDFDSLYEVMGGEFTAPNALRAFTKHKNDIEQLIPEDRLLEYHFSKGWKPLCDFVGVGVPDGDVPHLNIDTMFDTLT